MKKDKTNKRGRKTARRDGPEFNAAPGSAPRRRYPYRAQVIGPLCLTWCNQAARAPLVDTCFTRDKEGRHYKGWAILLKPWRRDAHGQRVPQPAFIVAWREKAQNAKVSDR